MSDEEIEFEGEAVCPVCKKTFEQYRPYQIYCSDKCRKTVYVYTTVYKKKEIKKKVCVECKCTFETNNPIKKFCSDTCQLSHKSKQYKKKQPVEKVCENCGHSFFTTNAIQKYCSRECYSVVAKKRYWHDKISKS